VFELTALTAGSRKQTVESREQTAESRQQRADSIEQTAGGRQQTSGTGRLAHSSCQGGAFGRVRFTRSCVTKVENLPTLLEGLCCDDVVI
jgi:hypothetical protein